MFLKSMFSAVLIGLASLSLSGCANDPYYYDRYPNYDPYYRDGYYAGSLILRDDRDRVRTRAPRQHVQSPPRVHQPRYQPPRAQPAPRRNVATNTPPRPRIVRDWTRERIERR